MQSLSRSLSVLVSSAQCQCECAYTMRVGIVLVVRPYVHHYIYGDKHTSVCEAIQISHLKGGSLLMPINSELLSYPNTAICSKILDMYG